MNVIMAISIFLVIFLAAMEDKDLSASRQIVEQAPKNAVLQKTSEYANIESTLQYVAVQLRLKVDVDGDGLSNCIDAAVLFYQYYPDRSKVRILQNKNPNNGFNHLFNSVYIDGVWIPIEPQAYYTNHNYYLMKNVWGKRYDSTYNRDETHNYSLYVR